MCVLPLHLCKEDFATNLHCVISNNEANIRNSLHRVCCCDNGIECALLKLPGSVRKSSPSRQQHPCLPCRTARAMGKNSHFPSCLSLLCVVLKHTGCFWASLSTVCKTGTKNDETVSQVNVVMVGIDSLPTSGEDAHAQPQLAVWLRQHCTCGQRWGYCCSFTASVGWEATLTTPENNNNRAVCCCY